MNPYKPAPDSKHPDYLVYIRDPEGDKLEIGVGWHREYERTGSKGEMISLTFDDPSFDKALNVTAFKGDDDRKWPITWRRREKTA